MFLKRPLVAIDIGSSSVKVLEFTGGSNKSIKTMGLRVLPPGLVADGEIKDIGAISTITKELLDKSGVSRRNRRAAISLKGSSVLIKKAMVTPNADSELSEQVFYEAQQLFQHDMDDMYFRYQEITSQLAKEGQKAMVLVGAKREIVEQHIAVVRNIGMRVGVVDCDVFCLSNAFDYNYPITDVMIANVNVGATSTRVLLSFGNEFLYTREFFIGGHDYSQKIAQAMSVTFDNAESVKISAGMGDQSVPPNIYQVINEVNDALVQEIQTTLTFFSQTEDVPENMKRPSMIFLSGGGARVVGLDAAIAAQLQVPVQIVNPFQRVDIGSSKFKADQLLSQGPIYTIACGLALRELDDSASTG